MDDIVKMAPELRTQGMQLCQSNVGCFGRIMPANRFPSNALSIQKLERWLKKINKSSISHVHLVHCFNRRLTIKTAISRQLSDHRTIFLLYPGLILFPVWPGAGQYDTPGRTVFKQGFVDKFGTVINIKAKKWEWQTFLNLINSLDDQLSVTRR
ncbi:hypothetical protein [Enterobacter asburiae]|uniref:hypothetical protein n=1 Tax=Enterobacter asburiae TaxID=61645 RepID=UPI001E36CDF4|nr:hypothetical protein [Enterobacter asburiae]MCE2004210.1 hypothetical protein [Enterobacter asburiae]